MSYSYGNLMAEFNGLYISVVEHVKLEQLINDYYEHDDKYAKGSNECVELINKYAFNFMKRVCHYMTVGDIDIFYANQFKEDDDKDNGVIVKGEKDYNSIIEQLRKYDDGEELITGNFIIDDVEYTKTNEILESFHTVLADGIQSLLRKMKRFINIQYCNPAKDEEIRKKILMFIGDMFEAVEKEITDNLDEISCSKAYEYASYIKNHYYELVIDNLAKENNELKQQLKQQL